MHTVLMVSICAYPILFLIVAAVHISNILVYAVQSPTEIFVQIFKWILIVSPIVFFAGYLLKRGRFKFYPRHIFNYYLGIFFLGLVYLFCEYLHAEILGTVQVSGDDPLIFPYPEEQYFRVWVRAVFCLFGAVHLLPFILFSPDGHAFVKRLMLSSAVFFLVFLNVLITTGECNYYLSALREKSFAAHYYSVFGRISAIQLARTPSYYQSPHILQKAAELAYQKGNVSGARKQFESLVQTYSGVPYHGEITSQTEKMLNSWGSWVNRTEKTIPGSDLSVILDIPVIQNADYLTINWYGVLSAIAFVNSDPSDLELKEKLLKLFSLDEHQLPLIETIPDLVPVLTRLGVPHKTAFFKNSLIIEALRQKCVPLIYYRYNWIPITGYDERRNGFLYYDYSMNYKSHALFPKAGNDIIYSHDDFPGTSGKPREMKYSVQKFISFDDLEQHVTNIGGIGLIVGSMDIIPEKEALAAYYIELGDIYYQMQNNFDKAAECYQRARDLHRNWVVLERISFLNRYYQQRRREVKGPNRLYSDYEDPPAWYLRCGFPPSLVEQLSTRILNGDAGWIILEQWPHRPVFRDSSHLDSIIAMYSFLHEKDPFSLDYLDSLAKLEYEKGAYHKSEYYYEKLLSLLPRGNPEVYLELAWVKLLLDKTSEIKDLISRTEPGYNPAKYLSLEGASYLHSGNLSKARKKLMRSLKEDKTLAETHLLLAAYFDKKGDTDNKNLHQHWYNRCKGILP
ncbi:hypothetical protein ACFL5V_02785 [Fibrobacterota bacterium]